MAPRLTPTERSRRQAAVLYAIAHHQAEHGYPPSMRYVRDSAGILGTDTTLTILRSMRAEGLIRYEDRMARTLVITPYGISKLNEAVKA